jgi:anti-sigma factor RsiW
MMTKLQLMAYTDGELSESEMAEVDGLLSRDVEARRFVAAVAEPAIGQFVRASEAARQSPSVVDVVMARIDAESVGSVGSERVTQASNVISLASRKRSDRVAFAAVAATTIAAMAASALVYVGAHRYSAQPASSGASVASVGAGETADDGSEIEVDSPAAVSVFAVEPGQSGSDMSAATLVWFDEDDDDDDTPGGDH